MAITKKLSSLADAIRLKSGYKSRMNLDKMQEVVLNMNTNIEPINEKITFNGLNSDVSKYMQDSEIYDTDDTVTSIPTTFQNDFSDIPNKIYNDVYSGFNKVSKFDINSEKGIGDISQSIAQNHIYSVEFNIPNNNVIYNALDNNNNIIDSKCFIMLGNVRMIDLGKDSSYNGPDNDGIRYFNIRDLGGWPADHGSLKYGLLYRGCELEGPKYGFEYGPYQDYVLKKEMGVQYEMDLRAHSSSEEDPGQDGIWDTEDDGDRHSILGEDFGYFSLRVPGKFKNNFPTGIGSLNGYNLSYYKRSYRVVIKQLADNIKKNIVTYIHCLAGADRTGTVCMLIEAICGVEKINLDRDYELTSFSQEWNKNTLMYNRNRRVRTENAFGSIGWPYMFEYLNSLSVPTGAIKRGTTDIGNTICGKVIYFLTASAPNERYALTEDEINDIRNGLINSDPTYIPQITISYS